MKLVIATQYMENYGSHDWDGEGECPQYWKMKGGTVYVVENLTEQQVNRAVGSEIPMLRSLIERSSDYVREYVIDFYGAQDDAKVGEEWETPIKLSYVDGAWCAVDTVVNDEYSFLRSDIKMMKKSWKMLPGGDREDYSVVYLMKDGTITKTLPEYSA